jgi:hypothetical protein
MSHPGTLVVRELVRVMEGREPFEPRKDARPRGGSPLFLYSHRPVSIRATDLDQRIANVWSALRPTNQQPANQTCGSAAPHRKAALRSGGGLLEATSVNPAHTTGVISLTLYVNLASGGRMTSSSSSLHQRHSWAIRQKKNGCMGDANA